MAAMIPRRKEGNGAPAPASEHPLSRLREEFEALFDQFFSRWPAPFEPGRGLEHFWGLDVEDAEDEIVVRAEVPGFEAEDFDVQISGNLLKIHAEQKRAAEEKEVSRYGERRHGRFQRAITLPASVDPDKVEARYHSGIMEVHLPKKPEARARHIPVKA